MLALEGDLRAHGGAIAFGSEVTGAHASADGGFVLAVAQAAGGVERLGCAVLVNAAGLRANDLARRVEGLPPERVPRLHLRRGTFFALRGRAPFRHLVVPTGPCYQGGGIYTLDLAGAARFGPDEDWTETIDYRLDEGRAAGFYRAVRRYYPDLPEDALEPAYVGIQPRLSPPGAPPADWIIDGPEGHGLPGLWNLFGIDSPGLTCAMALGAHVAGRVAAA
jgi:L-2-hydroxyglutarate oxidase LhgO